MKIRQYVKLVYPILVSAIIGTLITTLVFQLVQFSDAVTRFYTPTILASENFMEATSHMQEALKANPAGPIRGEVVYHHFTTAYDKLEKVFANQPREENLQTHGAGMLALAADVVSAVDAMDYENAKNLLVDLKQEAHRHHALHNSELQIAEKRIRQFAYVVTGLSLLILALGAGLTLREHRLQAIEKREVETIAVITALVNALEARDPYTGGHSSRVSQYAVAVAEELGLGRKEIRNLRLSALMHDVGKIGVPDSVLLKEGRLTDEEFALIREHPKTGAKIVKDTKSLNEMVPGILYHHERYDGKGYPEGLAGENIPLCAQTLAISDAYDAMTSSRPYRSAMSVETALREIEACRGSQWSSRVVDAFLTAYRQGLIYKETDADGAMPAARSPHWS